MISSQAHRGVTMSIRDILEKRRRIIVAVSVGAFLVLFLGVQLSVTLHRRWLAYLGAFVFLRRPISTPFGSDALAVLGRLGSQGTGLAEYYHPLGQVNLAPIAACRWKILGKRCHDDFLLPQSRHSPLTRWGRSRPFGEHPNLKDRVRPGRSQHRPGRRLP